jgi:membrane protein DedA with SNARE-associated domain
VLLASITDSFVHFATNVVNDLGLAGIFLLMLAESACIPIPSEATMLFAGFSVALGHHSLLEITIAGVLGNLVGSWIAYAVGYYGRMELVERHGRKLHIKPESIAWADRWFSRYGEATVFFTRLLPIIRTFISLPAGVARMPIWRFTVFTLLGCIPWVLLLGFIGQQVGHNWTQWKNAIGYFDYVVVAGVVIAIAYAVYRRRARRHAAPLGSETRVGATEPAGPDRHESYLGGAAGRSPNAGSAPVARVPGEDHGD